MRTITMSFSTLTLAGAVLVACMAVSDPAKAQQEKASNDLEIAHIAYPGGRESYVTSERMLTLVALQEAVPASAQRMAFSTRQHLVDIRAFSFVPQRTIVAPGDTIVWINHDIVPHTVTAESGAWAPRTLLEGESWEMLVEAGERYPYFCEFHPNMKGLLATGRAAESSD